MATDRLDRATTLARPDAHDDLVRQLDGQVRERVRREGVDPQRESLVVRRIAEDVVRDHDQLSLTGAVAPVADDGAMVGELVARVAGFGPLQPFLDDPEVEEIWIYRSFDFEQYSLQRMRRASSASLPRQWGWHRYARDTCYTVTRNRIQMAHALLPRRRRDVTGMTNCPFARAGCARD